MPTSTMWPFPNRRGLTRCPSREPTSAACQPGASRGVSATSPSGWEAGEWEHGFKVSCQITSILWAALAQFLQPWGQGTRATAAMAGQAQPQYWETSDWALFCAGLRMRPASPGGLRWVVSSRWDSHTVCPGPLISLSLLRWTWSQPAPPTAWKRRAGAITDSTASSLLPMRSDPPNYWHWINNHYADENLCV